MFKAISEDAKSKSLHFGSCVFTGVAIDHDAWQFWDFGDPAADFLSFDLELENQVRSWHLILDSNMQQNRGLTAMSSRQ